MNADDGDDPTPSPSHRRRTFGTFLVVVGALGMVVAALGAAAASTFVLLVEDDLEASTAVTVDAIEAAQASVEVFGSVLDTVRDQTGSLATALRDTADAVEQSRQVVDTTVDLTTQELPDVLDSVTELFPALETTAGSVDAALDALSRLPIGPDYDPAVPLEESVTGLGGELDDLSATVRMAGERLAETNEAVAGAPADLREVADTIEEVDADLVRTEALVAAYEVTLADAREVAVDALDDVEGGADWAVPIIVALAVVYALGQSATIWLGLRLRRGADLVVPVA